MKQSFQPWIEDPKITEPFGGVSVACLENGATTLLFSHSFDFLRVTFPQIHAMAVHEEFAHPHMDDRQSQLPKLPKGRGSYPLLVVNDSDWIKSFSDLRRNIHGEIPVHYQFITMGNYVDVLSYLPPSSEWLPSDAWEVLFGKIAP
jgi:hypothetical protein